MKKSENLGLIYVALGMLALIIGIWVAPVQKVVVDVQLPISRPIVHSVSHEFFTPKEQVLVAAFRHGWMGVQWTCLTRLITIENPGWDPKRRNAASTATGLFQVLRSASGRTFANYGVFDQARLGTKYISARYGNPCRALTFHLLNGYF